MVTQKLNFTVEEHSEYVKIWSSLCESFFLKSTFLLPTSMWMNFRFSHLLWIRRSEITLICLLMDKLIIQMLKQSTLYYAA